MGFRKHTTIESMSCSGKYHCRKTQTSAAWALWEDTLHHKGILGFMNIFFFCIVFLYMSAAWVARNDIKLSANWLTKMYDFLGCQKVTSPVSKHICIPYYQNMMWKLECHLWGQGNFFSLPKFIATNHLHRLKVFFLNTFFSERILWQCRVKKG